MKFWVFTVMLAIAQGFRTRAARGRSVDILVESGRTSAGSQNPPAGPILNQRENVNWTLGKLGAVDPNTLAVGVIEGVASLDFSAPLAPQLRELTVSTIGSIAGMVNPLLGAVFSIFAGLFGWGSSNGSADILNKIMEHVDKLITRRLDDFAREQVKTAISGAMDTIESAGDNVTRWGGIPTALADKFSAVFKTCWDREDSTCDSWRKEGSAGQGLILELQFTELMILATATVAEHGHSFRFMADRVKEAARLTRNHYNTFRAWRLSMSGSGGVSIGDVYCRGPRGTKCELRASRDKLKNRNLCSPYAGPFCQGRKCKPKMAEWRDRCINSYMGSISWELDRLKPQHEANLKAADSLVRAAR